MKPNSYSNLKLQAQLKLWKQRSTNEKNFLMLNSFREVKEGHSKIVKSLFNETYPSR